MNSPEKHLLTLILSVLFFAPPASATPLQEKGIETTLDVQYHHDKDFRGMAGGGAIYLILGDGYFEPGVEVEYSRVKFDEGFDDNVTGYIVSPRLHFNFTPENNITGFASLAVSTFGGDLSDYFSAGVGAGIGLKALLKNASPVYGLVEYERRGAKVPKTFIGNPDFEDRNVIQVPVGISLYAWDK
jgi:hypothetical protein